ncbi:MAG TPA: glycosyltransferase family 2 protein [Niabella sp.]|nr:glycosyltransferase family 2 protein [Niabella sp.]HQW14830.1 glycosyltransferase family 2 protein [Niabella sp.]HQX18545.1 glycosyltransferase family 2 protein [Niabella sp.]HQX40765.1 glycosyltransferase family 2 protein [Niabella sp.]HRB06072.1 glycosyltransferase family 2 protein [Niabella sp.]
MEKTLSIIIPVYNEEGALPLVLPDVMDFVIRNGYHLIMVNDGSKDRSLQVLEQFTNHYDHYKIVSHKLNKGYGGAIKSGILAAETDYVITIDADGQHYLEDVNHLFHYLKETDADMIVGSRKGLKEASVFRGVGKYIIRWVAKKMMPLNIYDINSGMKIYNSSLAKTYIKLCPNSMAYSDIIGLVFISQRHLVLEHPINIKPRVEGKSTIGVRTAFDTLMEILNVVILFKPMRIFLPLSLVFVFLGMVWALQFLIINRGLSIGASMLISVGVLFFAIGLISEQLSQIRKSSVLKDGDAGY